MANITLSFDNGPHGEVTPRVLDVLAQRHIRATFFVVGQRLLGRDERKVLRRIRAEGHWIGNHSYTHEVPLGDDASVDSVEREIIQTEDLLADLQAPTKLFRPFGGGGKLGAHLLNPAARSYLEANGYTCVLWNVVPGDWLDEDGWVETALAMCAAEPEPLVVLHDILQKGMSHLDRFCGTLLDAGHGFRQEFPDSCIVMRDGVGFPGLNAIVRAPS